MMFTAISGVYRGGKIVLPTIPNQLR